MDSLFSFSVGANQATKKKNPERKLSSGGGAQGEKSSLTLTQ